MLEDLRYSNGRRRDYGSLEHKQLSADDIEAMLQLCGAALEPRST